MGTAIGIDLGTTNTVVAAVRDGRAVTLDDEHGRRLIPSVVSFHPNGQVLVGQPAKERRYNDPTSTVYSVKRLIGRPWRSPEVQESLTRFAFELREGPKDTTMAVVRGEQYALPEVSAFVLRRAKQIAEARLGETVDRAVITVPANFNDLQRAATKVAGKLAGLEVLRILNEPTAAALAYGQSIAQSERIAIYDLGGGTFDVTLLDLSGSVFEVLATAGDTALGGDDLDVLVADRIATQFREIHRFDARANPEAFGRLRMIAEDMKIRLSTEEEVTVNLTDIAHGEGGAPLAMRFRLNRTELEHIAKPLIDKTMEVARFSIDTIGLRNDQFERVILVGGSTRMPFVARRVEQFFGRPPFLKVNPDEVVALGAAIQAFSLNKDARKPPAARYGADSTISTVTQTQVTMQTIQTLQTVATQQTMLHGPAPTIERTVPPEVLRASVTMTGVAPLPPRVGPAAGRPAKDDDPFASLDDMPRGPAVGAPSSATIKAAAAAKVEDPSMSFKVSVPNLEDPTLTKNTQAPVRPQPPRKPPPPVPAKKPPPAPPSKPKAPAEAEDPSLSFNVAELPDQNTSVSMVKPPAELDFSGLDGPDQEDRSIQSFTAPLPMQAPSAPVALPVPPPPNVQIRAADPQPYEPPLPLVMPLASVDAPDDGGIPAHVAPLLIDVTPLSLSVETVGGYCDVLIPANSPVPCDRTRTFLTAADGQTVVCVNVAQGESRRFLENTFLGQLDLHGLEPKDRGEVKIAVTFEIDADGILNVRAKDVQTGQERQARMRLHGASTSADVAAMLARQAQHEVH